MLGMLFIKLSQGRKWGNELGRWRSSTRDDLAYLHWQFFGIEVRTGISYISFMSLLWIRVVGLCAVLESSFLMSCLRARMGGCCIMS